MMKPLETRQQTFGDWFLAEEVAKWHFSPLNCTFLHCISKFAACKLALNNFLQ